MLKRLGHWFKKYFIPHEHNDHQPHILRTEATIFILFVILLIEFCFLAQPLFQKTNLFASILQNVLIDETNGSRQSENLSPLKENPLLDAAAKMKAEDMAAKSYFAHVSSEGVTPWYWFQKAGYDYSYAGENLAINFVDSEDVVKAWLNSPTHRQNILSRSFTEIGIATAKGIYEGKETIFIVQMFGRPAKLQVSASQLVAEKPLTAAVSPEAAGTGPVLSAVATAETTAAPSASVFTQKIIASPKLASNYLYAILLALVSLALLLNVVVKIKIQHPHLILNGTVLLLLINIALFLNNYLSLANAKIF